MLPTNERFRLVCRGVIKEIKQDQFVHKSVFLHRNDPYLILGPFKIEILSLSPIKLLVIEFFRDSESEWIKYYASAIYKPYVLDNFGENAAAAMSHTVGLPLNDSQTNLPDSIRLRKIHGRITLATGFVGHWPMGSELLRVSRYGIAGRVIILYYI